MINWENNLSSYERNRVFLNLAGREFLEISHLTGADSDGDGRAVVAADLDRNGREELIVRQTGGGPLLVFDNQFPGGHFLEVTLRGSKSNAFGIGARLVAEIGGRQVARDQFPVNSFRSQAANRVHFGLGEATRVDSLTVRWPSGTVSVLRDLPANQRIEVREEL